MNRSKRDAGAVVFEGGLLEAQGREQFALNEFPVAFSARPHRRWTRSADGLASTGLAAGRAWPPIVEYCLATREPRIAASQAEQAVGAPRSVR